MQKKLLLLTKRRGPPTMSLVKTELGQILRAARERQGLSLKALALQAGIPWRSIYGIEIGESLRPRERTLRQLAAALGLPYGGLALAAYGANGFVPTAPPDKASLEPVGSRQGAV